MSDNLFITKLCKNKFDCLNEINFRVNLFLNLSYDFTGLHGQKVIPHRPAKCAGIGFVEDEILGFQFDMWALVIT